MNIGIKTNEIKKENLIESETKKSWKIEKRKKKGLYRQFDWKHDIILRKIMKK